MNPNIDNSFRILRIKFKRIWIEFNFNPFKFSSFEENF